MYRVHKRVKRLVRVLDTGVQGFSEGRNVKFELRKINHDAV